MGGFIVTFTSYHKYTLMVCATIMTAFVGAMAAVQPGETSMASTFIALMSASCGIIETASRSLLPLTCPDEDIGAAIGILGTAGYGSSAVASAHLIKSHT